MIFHMPQKHINIPSLKIDNTNTHIKRVAELNFLGFTINQHLKWDSRINKIVLKIYKLKNIFSQNILLTLYNTIILPHIHYDILLGGYNLSRIGSSSKLLLYVTFRHKL